MKKDETGEKEFWLATGIDQLEGLETNFSIILKPNLQK